MKKYILLPILALCALDMDAENFRIDCISGYGQYRQGQRLEKSSPLSADDIITASTGGCRIILESISSSDRYLIQLNEGASVSLKSITDIQGSSPEVQRLNMKTEFNFDRDISWFSTGESKRGGEFGETDYSVGLSIISKCSDNIFSIDSLPHKSPDMLLSLNMKQTDGQDVAIISNYEQDSVYVATYSFQRYDSEVYLGKIRDMWTLCIAPMSDMIFIIPDIGGGTMDGILAVASYHPFNYIDTFNAIDNAEGSQPVKTADLPVGFALAEIPDMTVNRSK